MIWTLKLSNPIYILMEECGLTYNQATFLEDIHIMYITGKMSWRSYGMEVSKIIEGANV